MTKAKTETKLKLLHNERLIVEFQKVVFDL